MILGQRKKYRVFWSLSDHSLFFQLADGTFTIICFDVKTDEVKENHDMFCLATLRSCLCLYGGNIKHNQLDIWIMEEQDGRWKWLMNICNLPSICQRFVQDMKLLCCTKDGGVVFQGKWCHQLIIYNPKQQQFVFVSNHDENVSPPIASVYLDSLYFSTLNVERKRRQRYVTPNNQTPK
ncbi:hypothetical protein FXO37_06097 [Capsicum annuum]|nr:hypothetical protein FXO37_06097 [Capsicum annuum]